MRHPRSHGPSGPAGHLPTPMRGEAKNIACLQLALSVVLFGLAFPVLNIGLAAIAAGRRRER